ncbi:MAG: hypothetical protein WD883_00010 [Candidatus Colwellbacteria bacterium]
MALTEQQNIPEKPVKSEPWTFRKLFSSSGADSLVKTFSSPLEVMFGYMVIIIGIAILFGQSVPTLFYGLSFCLLAVVIYERLGRPVEVAPKKSKK